MAKCKSARSFVAAYLKAIMYAILFVCCFTLWDDDNDEPRRNTTKKLLPSSDLGQINVECQIFEIRS